MPYINDPTILWIIIVILLCLIGLHYIPRRYCPWKGKPVPPREVDDDAHKGLVKATSTTILQPTWDYKGSVMPSDDEIERQLAIYRDKYPNVYKDVTVEKVKEWYRQDLGIDSEPPPPSRSLLTKGVWLTCGYCDKLLDPMKAGTPVEFLEGQEIRFCCELHRQAWKRQKLSEDLCGND